MGWITSLRFARGGHIYLWDIRGVYTYREVPFFYIRPRGGRLEGARGSPVNESVFRILRVRIRRGSKRRRTLLWVAFFSLLFSVLHRSSYGDDDRRFLEMNLFADIYLSASVGSTKKRSKRRRAHCLILTYVSLSWWSEILRFRQASYASV